MTPTSKNPARVTRATAIAAVGLALALLGCAGGPPGYVRDGAEATVVEAPLGGEALYQRKQDLIRAQRDMTAFHATLASLVDRRDSRGQAVFDAFLVDYMGRHLDPLLGAEWQSTHPEVMATDANLRFLKAEVLVQMRYPRLVQGVIDDIERRYTGQDALLVDYPVGEQSSLVDALALLRDRKWGE